MNPHPKEAGRSSAGKSRRSGFLRAAPAALILLGIGAWARAQIGNVYDRQLDHKFNGGNAAQADENRMTPEQIKMLDLERAIKAQAQKMSLPPPPPPPQLPTASVVGSAIAVTLGGALLAGVATLLVKRKFDALSLAAEAARTGLNVLEMDPSLDGFFTELRDGLGAQSKTDDALIEADPSGAPAVLEPFLASAPSRFADLRALVSQIGRTPDAAARKELFASLYEQVRSLKENSRIPALQPAWLMACALEGLLKQLLNEASEFKASAERSATAAIDLLERLCVKGVNPELASNPPIRILAVDDDPVSRCAMSFALKKAFNEPTMAPGGKEALALATRQPFDIIFLDVEMPGMDGFEVCTKIHETDWNRTTPVVFVTRHSDFDSRAKSNLSGGQDLIGKPYLSFEITVKALTLVLRNRLEPGAVARRAIKPAASALLLKDGMKDSGTGSAAKPDLKKLYSASMASTYSISSGDSESESARRDSAVPLPMRAGDSADPFPDWAPAYLENIRNQVHAATQCKDAEDLHEFITGAFVAIHSFAGEAERAGLNTIHKLSSVLEGMLKKLTDNPKLVTPSTLDAALAALDLLRELSARDGTVPDFADPLPRILVVDDDPLARRAVAGSIQLVFGKPDTAESGEAAITMAADKPFDLIFLDVVMPGIDGFATCKKIHQTIANHQTPVVFVTTSDDAHSREQASLSGGCGFIPKPVLSGQITLMAITFILRARLEEAELSTYEDPKATLISDF